MTQWKCVAGDGNGNVRTGEVLANLPHEKGDRMNIKLPFITLDDLDDILFRDDDPDYHDEEIEPDVFDDIRRLEDERCTQ